jgi:hypothetical protein
MKKGRSYTRQQMINALQKAYPTQFISTTEEFSGTEGGIWLSGEDGTVDRKGVKIFNYYNMSDQYELGVVAHLDQYVECHGWYFEWYDAGTIMLWKL